RDDASIRRPCPWPTRSTSVRDAPTKIQADRREVEVGAKVVLGGNDVVSGAHAPLHVAVGREVHTAAQVESELALRSVSVARRALQLARHAVETRSGLRVGLG